MKKETTRKLTEEERKKIFNDALKTMHQYPEFAERIQKNHPKIAKALAPFLREGSQN